MEIKKIFKEANTKFGVQQLQREFIPFLIFIKKYKIDTCIEIGAATGGGSLCLAHFTKKKLISIDLLREDRRVRREIDKHCLYYYISDKSGKCINSVDTCLGDDKADLLFIDGDHTYQGAKRDLFKYFQFVKKGGIIALHDIKNTEFHRKSDCHVYKLWDEIKAMGYKTREFCDHSKGWGGIGVIEL